MLVIGFLRCFIACINSRLLMLVDDGLFCIALTVTVFILCIFAISIIYAFLAKFTYQGRTAGKLAMLCHSNCGYS